MGRFSPTGRGLAGVVALCAWVGLAVQLQASTALTGGDVVRALSAMARYFTVLTNLLLAIVFSSLALGGRLATPSMMGGVTLAILLVGVVYGLLLRDLLQLSGGAKFADVLLHHVTPALAPLFWLGYAPKGELHPRDPWLWTIFPVAYFAYALVRGMSEGNYAYPFMDPVALGWGRVVLNAGMIALAFVGASLIVLWLDRRLAGRPPQADFNG